VRTIAALAMAVSALFTSVTADANSDELWPTIICRAGELQVANATVETGSNGYRVQVPGSLNCGSPDFGPLYGIADYTPGIAQIYRLNLKHYATPTGPTTFTWVGDHTRAGDVFCLVTGPSKRVSCMKVVAAADSVAVVGVPTNDPLVTKPFELIDNGGPALPECPSCW
jgi:hypothetical protein